MKEKWEKDKAVTDFFKNVSMGDCQTWLQDLTVSHGDVLEEVSHSFVLLPLLFHLPSSRMNLCPVSIFRIKAEAHFSIEAELPRSTDVSILFTLARHLDLHGQRA